MTDYEPRCPYCLFEISPELVGDPYARSHAEVAHMNEAHPDVVERRLTAAGFRRGADGDWIDTKVDGPPFRLHSRRGFRGVA